VHARYDSSSRLALDAEEEAVPGLAEALARAGADLPIRPMGSHSMYFGGVGAVVLGPTGELVAAGDRRREGAVAVV
jgi:hypothetical protein